MTRSSHIGELEYDPELERTVRRLRREARQAQALSPPSTSTPCRINIAIDLHSQSSYSESASEEEDMAANDRTFKQLAAPALNEQPLCIEFPALGAAFELKSGLIHLLPTFRGLADSAKDWLYDLPSGSINSWNEMKRSFLEKFFPTSQAASIRKDICGIRQLNGETLYEYWERFKKLCASCPHHQIPEQLLIQYFYEGLMPMDRNMIDAASGGVLMDKTPAAVRTLIANMAANSQQFGAHMEHPAKQVSEVSTSNIERQIFDLTTLVKQMAIGSLQAAKVCGICTMIGHPTDMCPTLQEEDSTQQANAIGGFPGQPQLKFDPYPNTYTPGFKHPNLSYDNPAVAQNSFKFPYPARHQQGTQPPNSGMALDELIKTLANNTQQFQQETRSSVQNLEKQISQLAMAVSNLEAQGSGKLPSQTIVNPRENASAVTLRSGTKTADSNQHSMVLAQKNEEEREANNDIKDSSKVTSQPTVPNSSNTILVPFPSRLSKSKKEQQEKDILETFRKVEVNIPLLDAIKQVPKYAKFLKELCTTKRKLRSDEKVKVGENVSTMIQRKLPPKQKDPGMFTIPCVIGNKKIERAMLDLGASINVRPHSIYASLNLGPLKETRVIIQLVDRSNAYPDGVVEDVLVQVDELIFPADFYILNMEDGGSPNPASILLGRPFLKIAKTRIDDGTLTMEFDGEVVKFNIFDAMRYPNDTHSLFCVDLIEVLVQEAFELMDGDELGIVLAHDLEKIDTILPLNSAMEETIMAMESLPPVPKRFESSKIELPLSHSKLLPSIVQVPTLELKPLLGHLKYVHLGDNNTLPVIIAHGLTALQEERLIRVLRDHITAIGWTLADIKGISPSMALDFIGSRVQAKSRSLTEIESNHEGSGHEGDL
ncbi:uncharacterized protein LOC120003252 isoform X2 [Tripterygium wilfordii]|uniref:uncharacterized protein LOC120003252 isoform X2 n=1 Tax=Tripterygium wilfordii TaxID=458696 RepID=UPI0018F7E631|nr:uncharacterized protein LOC120003252 isoform X2 [Tripterygium wilfordii]